MDGSARRFVQAILRTGLKPVAGPLRRDPHAEAGARRAGRRGRRARAGGDAVDRLRDRLPRRGDRPAGPPPVDGQRRLRPRAQPTAGPSAGAQDVEAMQANGLALGGSLDNAVVVEGDAVLNPGGFRRADECVRHKMLDALGDLALAGAPILGAYRGVRAGHGATNRLLRKLFATPERLRDASRSTPRRRASCPARASARRTCAAPVEAGRAGPSAAPAHPGAALFVSTPPKAVLTRSAPGEPERAAAGQDNARERQGVARLASRGTGACRRPRPGLASRRLQPDLPSLGCRLRPARARCRSRTARPQQIYLGAEALLNDGRPREAGAAVLRGRAALSLLRVGQARDADVGLRLPRGRRSTPRAAPPPSATSSSSPPTSTRPTRSS